MNVTTFSCRSVKLNSHTFLRKSDYLGKRFPRHYSYFFGPTGSLVSFKHTIGLGTGHVQKDIGEKKHL